jgi:hypothetical protein
LLCQSCGSEERDGEEICSKCGSLIQNVKEAPQASNNTRSGNTVSSLVHATQLETPKHHALPKISNLSGLFAMGAALYVLSFLLWIFARNLYVADVAVGIVATGSLSLAFMKYPNQELNSFSSKAVGFFNKIPILNKLAPFASRLSKYPQFVAILSAGIATLVSFFFASGSSIAGVTTSLFGAIATGLTVIALLLNKRGSFGNTKLIGSLYLLAIIMVWLNGYSALDSGWFFSLFMMQAEYEAFKNGAIADNR